MFIVHFCLPRAHVKVPVSGSVILAVEITGLWASSCFFPCVIQIIRKDLEISGIQDVRLKYKQNWINHLERTDNTRLQKHAFNYKPR